MPQASENPFIVNSVPTEMLLLIFSHLPAKQLIRLREVCIRWRNIVDDMTTRESLWREHCEKDFTDVYKIARFKGRAGMLWFYTYRSLALWPFLNLAREIRDEFAFAGCANDEIRGFEILEEGIFGLHKRDSIVYYDIETRDLHNPNSLFGEYMHYAETKDTLVMHTCNLHLIVSKKMCHTLHSTKTNIAFDGVKLSLIVKENLFYVDINNDIFICKLKEEHLAGILLKHSDEAVMCLGYSDHLNVLTFERKIYKIVKENLVLACNLDNSQNILHELYKFNLLETTDWRVVFQWLCILRQRLPVGPLQEILTVRVYGDIFLVGCNWGVLRIYYAPFTNGEFDLYNAKPMKQYNFLERSDCPVLTMCPILKIDVMEAEDGHMVIVAMPKKIALIEFVHSFEREPSAAMVPYNENRLKMETDFKKKRMVPILT